MIGVMNNVDGNLLKYQSVYSFVYACPYDKGRKDGRQRDPSFTSKFCKTD